MKTINNHTSNTLEIKQSKFIAHLFVYDQYESILAQLKEQHPKARHFVNAFRYLNEHDQIVEGFSDDGEPRGTSGKPTLAVLQGADLINIGVITVRYFGGTKLGTGGLVRAYSDALNLVIDDSELVEYKKLEKYKIVFNYNNISKVEYELSNTNISTVDKSFDISDVTFTLLATKEDFNLLIESIKRLVKIVD